MPANVTFSGGEKIQALFKNAGKGGVKSVDVGVFAGSKYQDGTPVALVATVNEFGGDINHPGGTPYKIGKGGKAVFVKKGTPGIIGTTKPHKIKIPERPAFRNANKSNEDSLIKIIKSNVDPETMVIDPVTAGKVGVAHESAVKKSIVDLKDPPNAASTLKAKAPKANPLVNTGMLARSVTHEVNK